MPTFVGLDMHLRTCHVTVMNEQGDILRQEKFPNERRELERIFKGIKGKSNILHRSKIPAV